MSADISIDPFSAVPLYLKVRFGEQHLATATGFAYESDGDKFLVTNWHVVAGRHPESGQPLDKKNGAVPDRLRIFFHVDGKLGSWTAADLKIVDDDSEPIWWQHPIHGQRIDVAVLPFECPSGLTVYPLNSIEMVENMRVGVGQDIFVLGYPLNFRAGGVLPIWKRASLASEPDLDIDELPLMVADTATYKGMSGAPVFARQWGNFISEDGGMNIGSKCANRFIGIYSGRMRGKDGDIAQLGRVWKARTITEILATKTRGKFELS